MVAAGAIWTRRVPLRVSRTRVLVPASTALTNPIPALTCAEARGSSAAAADRPDTPGSAKLIPAPSSSASTIIIGPFRFMTLLLSVDALHLTHYYDEAGTTSMAKFRKNALFGFIAVNQGASALSWSCEKEPSRNLGGVDAASRVREDSSHDTAHVRRRAYRLGSSCARRR